MDFSITALENTCTTCSWTIAMMKCLYFPKDHTTKISFKGKKKSIWYYQTGLPKMISPFRIKHVYQLYYVTFKTAQDLYSLDKDVENSN